MSNALTRFLSVPVNKPYRTRDLDHTAPPTLDDDGYLIFSPNDPENPKNWSVRRRALVTGATILLVMNATFASSSPSGCFESMATYFGVSDVVVGLTITLFLLGYVAGPLIWAPISEFYGRRYVFYTSFLCYIAFNFLCAFAPNFGSLLVGRFLTGTFVSSSLSNGPGLLADVWDPLQMGNAMACFSMFLWIGPAMGPVVAGFLELKKDWRWSFYVLLWLGGISAVFMFTIPETHAPTLLVRKARRARKAQIPGFENVKARTEDQGSLGAIFKVALIRPWVILFDTISLLCAIYLSVVYCLLYMLFTIYPIVFQQMRGWNSGVGELPLCGTVVGAVFGGLIVFYDTHRRSSKIRSGEKKMEDIEPEERLPLAMLGGIIFAVSMFWFAWTGNFNSVHWIVPTIAGGFLGCSLLLIFVAYLSYIVDSYLMYAASASAANTIARSACGAAAPLFTSQMFKAMGVGGGGSLVGGLATVLAVIPFLFYKYGKQIRMRSKFAPTKEKELHKQRDEERDPTEYHTGALENEREEATTSDDDDDDDATQGSSSSSTVNPGMPEVEKTRGEEEKQRQQQQQLKGEVENEKQGA